MKDKKKEDDVKKVKKSLIGAPSEARAPAGQNLKGDDATVKKDTVKANTQPTKEQSKEAPKQIGKPPDGKKENQESKEKPQDGKSAEKNQKDKPKDVLKVEQKPSKDRVTTERRTTATRDTKETKESMERAEPPAAQPPPKKVFLLKKGEMLLNKFRVEGLLADGGFAQVYAAIHEDSQTRWAVKIESEKCDRKRMKLEIMVLMLLRGKANIPEIMAMGTCPTGHFIILELVGRNLSDLRRQLPHRKLSPGSLYRAMLQVTHALSLVHGAGFLHRDLKPSNCCVGVDDVSRIYLLDYGLARQYLDSAGQIRKPRESIGMRGTMRYVSLEAHARHDLGPNHDLVALLYSIIELGDGRLPWTKMREEPAIKASKQETTAEKLCEKQPKMLKMAEYVLGMKYETMPDYDRLIKMLEACHPPDVKSTDPYDWQTTTCQLEHFVRREKADAEPAEEKPGADAKKEPLMASIPSEMDKAKH